MNLPIKRGLPKTSLGENEKRSFIGMFAEAVSRQKEFSGVPKTKTLAAIVIAAAAICVWARPLLDRSLSEDSLRDTTGVQAKVLSMQPAESGCRLKCQIVNQRDCAAAQIVLKVELTDASGRVLAANPLVGVPNVAAGGTQTIDAFIPLRETAANVYPQATVSLVRWAK